MCRNIHTKHIEYSGADIHQSWIFFINLMITKYNTRNQRVINAVISTPGFNIIVEYLPCNLPYCGFPRCAVADMITDNQVR